MSKVTCISCGLRATDDADITDHRCRSCAGILEASPIDPDHSYTPTPAEAASLWKYKAWLPVSPATEVVTLGEGMTPLLRCPGLDDLVERRIRIWVKDETRNPSGSFKDRLISVAITRARAQGADTVTCASSGNAAAATAAYAAAAQLQAVVFVPTGTPHAKIAQALAYGAHVIAVPGDYSNSYRVCATVARAARWPNLTTTYLNPYGTSALSTVGHELFDQFSAVGRTPDLVVIPVGSGPLLYGVDRGWREAAATAGKAERLPLLAVQPNGCAPITAAFEAGLTEVTSWGRPDTIASGISDPLRGYPEDGTLTLDIIRASGGAAVAVSDDDIVWATQQLARRAGILAEPTGAAPLAGLASHLAETRGITPLDVVICVTGHGFKDPARTPHPVQPPLTLSAQDTGALIDSATGPESSDALGRIHAGLNTKQEA